MLIGLVPAPETRLLDAFPGFIARLDGELTYTYANQRLCDLLGLPVDRVVGRPATMRHDAAAGTTRGVEP